MRTLKFRIVYQHDETGRIATRFIELGEAIPSLGDGWAIIGKDQYIGIKDKNGREIYEGDIVGRNAPGYVKSIVRIGESETEVDVSSEYSISKPYYGVYLEGSIDLEARLLRGEMEVIGNIYEHPDLVTQELHKRE